MILLESSRASPSVNGKTDKFSHALSDLRGSGIVEDADYLCGLKYSSKLIGIRERIIRPVDLFVRADWWKG